MKSIREFCNERQNTQLDIIESIMSIFAIGNSNPATYSLAGLITELVGKGFVDAKYLHEKFDTILYQLKED